MTDRHENTRDALSHEIWAAAQLAPGEGIADGAARVEALLREALAALKAENEMLRNEAELEEDRQAERDRILGARVREIARQHDARLDPYGFARAVMRAMEEEAGND